MRHHFRDVTKIVWLRAVRSGSCIPQAGLSTWGPLEMLSTGDKNRLCLRTYRGGHSMENDLEGEQLGARRLTGGCQGSIHLISNHHRAPSEAAGPTGALTGP